MAKKDFNAPKHDEIDVPNLQVIKAMQVCGAHRSLLHSPTHPPSLALPLFLPSLSPYPICEPINFSYRGITFMGGYRLLLLAPFDEHDPHPSIPLGLRQLPPIVYVMSRV